MLAKSLSQSLHCFRNNSQNYLPPQLLLKTQDVFSLPHKQLLGVRKLGETCIMSSLHSGSGSFMCKNSAKSFHSCYVQSKDIPQALTLKKKESVVIPISDAPKPSKEVLTKKQSEKNEISKTSLSIQGSTSSNNSNFLSAETLGQNVFKTHLGEEYVMALKKQFGITNPSEIQRLSIPAILQTKQDILFGARTGTGKTLAYLLPLMYKLKKDEEKMNKESKDETNAKETSEADNSNKLTSTRKKNRPRLMIFVPSRELALQVHSVIKKLSHIIKLRSVLLRSDYKLSRLKSDLSGYPTDILVTTPRIFMKMYDQKYVFFTDLKYVAVDEFDTMISKGFQEDMSKIMEQCLVKRKYVGQEMQFVFILASFTQQVNQYLQQYFPNVVKISSRDAHKCSPKVEHHFINCTANIDKMEALIEVLQKDQKKQPLQESVEKESHEKQTSNESSVPTIEEMDPRILIFCNTVSSCRAVHHAVEEAGFKASCFHSELQGKRQFEEFTRFKERHTNIMIATDLASRGIDIPDLTHVIMFDFPFNTIDYLHRSGRTGRMNKRGTVSSLLQKKDLALAEKIQEIIKKQSTFEGIDRPTPEEQRKMRQKANTRRSQKRIDKRNPGKPIANKSAYPASQTKRRTSTVAFQKKSSLPPRNNSPRNNSPRSDHPRSNPPRSNPPRSNPPRSNYSRSNYSRSNPPRSNYARSNYSQTKASPSQNEKGNHK